jgi:hypothetical protein
MMTVGTISLCKEWECNGVLWGCTRLKGVFEYLRFIGTGWNAMNRGAWNA